jgi:S1-C subfamily serine protease
MLLNYLKIFIILYLLPSTLISQATSSWPENINNLKTGICLVEYFQPQFEMGEIEDKSRIKKKITGVLVNNEGLVITSDIIYPANLDIVENNLMYISTQPMPENITISFTKDKKHKARFIGKDEELRIAFIEIIDSDSLPNPVRFTSKNDFEIGDPFYLIQHLSGQYDFEIVITGHNINSIIEKPKKRLLTTSNVAPLSAGGLAVDGNGMAIGVVFRSENYYSQYAYSFDDPSMGLSLFQIVPSIQFLPLFAEPPRLVTQKEGSGKSWLGIQMQILTKHMAAYWDLKNKNGIIINKVLAGSPAEKGGLKAGDIILSLGNLQIDSYDKLNLDILRDHIRNLPEGNITVQILRKNKSREATIYLESAPKSRFLAEEYSDEFLGLGVKELTQDYINGSDLEFDTEGVWVSRIEDAGSASIAGIDVSDLILSINDDEIKNLEDFENTTKELKKAKSDYIQVFIKRQGKTRFMFIKTFHDNNKM